MPNESTARKLTRWLGPERVAELIREVIGLATRERRFAARAIRSARRWSRRTSGTPTDAGLAASVVRLLARVHGASPTRPAAEHRSAGVEPGLPGDQAGVTRRRLSGAGRYGRASRSISTKKARMHVGRTRPVVRGAIIGIL